MEKDFEQYLMEYFTANYPEILDDDIPDAFDNWLSEDADIDTIIKLGQKYSDEEYKKGFMDGVKRQSIASGIADLTN